MKLDLDCVLDVLRITEEKATLNDNLEFDLLTPLDFLGDNSPWSIPEIVYTVIQLKEAGFITAACLESDDCISECVVCRLTYDGHQFLEKLKPPSVAKKVKTVLNKLGTTSFEVAISIASQVITNMLTTAI